jgi:hypothetical protein
LIWIVFIRSPEIPTTPTIAETRRAKETRRSARKIWTWTNPPSILILIHILTTERRTETSNEPRARLRTHLSTLEGERIEEQAAPLARIGMAVHTSYSPVSCWWHRPAEEPLCAGRFRRE